MLAFREVDGDLIELAKQGEFDVIVHGCNCFCTMGAGIAVAMRKEFFANTAAKENRNYFGDYSKMGTIDWVDIVKSPEEEFRKSVPNDYHKGDIFLTVVNAYTQYNAGAPSPGCNIPLDYAALAMCLKKINYQFEGHRIGLPQIGAGLAGGDWKVILGMIKKYLDKCDVTIVNYNK